MKKLLIPLASLTVLFAVLSAVHASGGQYFTFTIPRNQKEMEIKRAIDSEIMKNRQSVAIAASQQYGLSLQQHRQIPDPEIYPDPDLVRAYFEVIKTQRPGDTKPILYLSDTETAGYIIEKKANDQIIVYALSKDDSDRWSMRKLQSMDRRQPGY